MTRDQKIGRALVIFQFVLLAALVLLPPSDDWPTPAWVELIGVVLVVIGVGTAVVASRGLGSALTATPVPKEDGTFTREGLYATVRHPIYSGVLVAAAGLALRAGRWEGLTLALAAVVFFWLKSEWEERMLTQRYPEYAAYAASTPRFVPRVRLGRR